MHQRQGQFMFAAQFAVALIQVAGALGDAPFQAGIGGGDCLMAFRNPLQ